MKQQLVSKPVVGKLHCWVNPSASCETDRYYLYDGPYGRQLSEVLPERELFVVLEVDTTEPYRDDAMVMRILLANGETAWLIMHSRYELYSFR